MLCCIELSENVLTREDVRSHLRIKKTRDVEEACFYITKRQDDDG